MTYAEQRAAVRVHVSNFLLELAGGDPLLVEEMDTYHDDREAPRAVVEEACRLYLSERLDVRGTPEAVASDLDRVHRGEPARHFVTARYAADAYRAERGIYMERRHDALRSQHDLLPAVLGSLLTAAEERNQTGGADLYDYRHGVACRREQRHFYQSHEWTDVAKGARVLDGFRCRSCGATDVPLEVHHHDPVYSAYSALFPRLFDLGRLRTMCQPCHARFHAERTRAHYGFARIAGDRAAVATTKRREQITNGRRERLHDQKRECPWCLRYTWGGFALPAPVKRPTTGAHEPDGNDPLPFG